MSEVKTEDCKKCQRCGENQIFEILMGFKCVRSEWETQFQGVPQKNEEQTGGRFFSMEDGSPFAKVGNICDARVAICLQCGQTQGKFPATNPLVCLAIANGVSQKGCECSICEHRRNRDGDSEDDSKDNGEDDNCDEGGDDE